MRSAQRARREAQLNIFRGHSGPSHRACETSYSLFFRLQAARGELREASEPGSGHEQLRSGRAGGDWRTVARSRASSFAPFRMRTWTHRRWPEVAARCSGVQEGTACDRGRGKRDTGDGGWILGHSTISLRRRERSGASGAGPTPQRGLPR